MQTKLFKQTGVGTFQLILMVFFGLAAFGAFVLFSTYRSGEGDEANQIPIRIWGVLDRDLMQSIVQGDGITDPEIAMMDYIQIFPEDDLNLNLLEAFDGGYSPDLVLLSEEEFFQNQKRFLSVGEELYPKAQFKNTFVMGSEVYLGPGGILAFPILLDPLIMFWNRDIFASEGVVRVPEKWEDFYNLSERLNVVDENFNVFRSTLSFGEAVNVDNFKEILLTLFLQVGNPISAFGEEGMESVLSGNEYYPSVRPVLSFFTEFSDPARANYSWNRSLPSSKRFFLSGDLATYFGFSSEAKSMRLQNPNLNFDIAEVPQADGVKRKAVFGHIYALAIPSGASNPNRSFAFIQKIMDPAVSGIFSKKTFMAPARLDLIDEKQANPDFTILNREALYALSFQDIHAEKTKDIFKNMIEYVTSGRKSPIESVALSDVEMDFLLDESL